MKLAFPEGREISFPRGHGRKKGQTNPRFSPLPSPLPGTVPLGKPSREVPLSE